MKKVGKIREYTAIFESDKESGGFTVYIPALPGCISEGKNFEEARKNIEEAAMLYLETVSTRAKSYNFLESNFIVAPVRLSF